MNISKDHFLQAAYIANFSHEKIKNKSRDYLAYIINSSVNNLQIREQPVKNFGNSSGLLLNAFDDPNKDPISINKYGFYWKSKENYLNNFLSPNEVKNKQEEIKQYFSLLWARNLFGYEDAREKVKFYKNTGECHIPPYIIYNLKDDFNSPNIDIQLVANKILMERFNFFYDIVRDYSVGHLVLERPFLFIGENPVFNLSVLVDNDINILRSLIPNISVNALKNTIFVPLSWNQVYYLYRKDADIGAIEKIINFISISAVYNTYAVWMSSRQTLVNKYHNESCNEDKLVSFYKETREKMENHLSKTKV